MTDQPTNPQPFWTIEITLDDEEKYGIMYQPPPRNGSKMCANSPHPREGKVS